MGFAGPIFPQIPNSMGTDGGMPGLSVMARTCETSLEHCYIKVFVLFCADKGCAQLVPPGKPNETPGVLSPQSRSHVGNY